MMILWAYWLAAWLFLFLFEIRRPVWQFRDFPVLPVQRRLWRKFSKISGVSQIFEEFENSQKLKSWRMEARSNVELINRTTFDFVPFRGRKVLSGGDCNNPEILSQFKIFILAILANFEYLKWIILNKINENLFWIYLECIYLYASSLEYK